LRRKNIVFSSAVIAGALISFIVLVNIDSYDFSTLSSPVGFDNIQVTRITENSATVVGTTLVPVDCQVAYGIGVDLYRTASDNDRMGMPHTEHLIVLSDLEPDTEYYYQFMATLDGENYFSDVKTMVTSPKTDAISEMEES